MSKISERFRECAKDPDGKVYFDYFDDGMRVLIMKGPASVNCYLGVPVDHPLAGYDYEKLPLDCHGGLTFSKEGGGKLINFPAGFYWYGFDYAHCDDVCFYDLRYSRPDREGKAWTPEDVKGDAWHAIYSMKALMFLAERIAEKASSKK